MLLGLQAEWSLLETGPFTSAANGALCQRIKIQVSMSNPLKRLPFQKPEEDNCFGSTYAA